jgi:hypothetical protein
VTFGVELQPIFNQYTNQRAIRIPSEVIPRRGDFCVQFRVQSFEKIRCFAKKIFSLAEKYSTVRGIKKPYKSEKSRNIGLYTMVEVTGFEPVKNRLKCAALRYLLSLVCNIVCN